MATTLDEATIARDANRRIRRSDNIAGWAFAGPSVFIVLGLSFIPMIWAALPVAHGLESPIGWPLHRVRELRRPGQGSDAPPGVHEHVSPRPDVPADRPGGRAGRGDPAEPEDQAHRLLPHLLPRAVRRVGGGRGPAVRVHLRSRLRDRERRTAGGGAAAPGLSPGPLRGPGRAGDRVLLDPVRLQHRDLPRRAPGHPPGGPRGGVDRWRGQDGPSSGTSPCRPSGR